MTDHAGGSVGFLFGKTLRNAPNIAALCKSHENVDQRDAGTFERKYWEVREGLKGDMSRFLFGDDTPTLQSTPSKPNKTPEQERRRLWDIGL